MALVCEWGDRGLRDGFVRTTIKYVRVLVESPSLLKTNERSLLRNLASFLGKLTLADNRPVLQARGSSSRAFLVLGEGA